MKQYSHEIYKKFIIKLECERNLEFNGWDYKIFEIDVNGNKGQSFGDSCGKKFVGREEAIQGAKEKIDNYLR